MVIGDISNIKVLRLLLEEIIKRIEKLEKDKK